MKKYTDYLKQKGKLSSVRFRDKSLGYQYSTMEVVYKDGKIERNGIESDQWLRMFFSGMILRPSCPTCNFRSVERCSDFTIWDCFNVSDLTKELDETKGATRMLIHTKRGQEIFNEIRDRFYVVDADVKTVAVGITEKPDFNKKKYERLPFELVYATDIDQKALNSHMKNFNCENVVCKDICETKSNEIPNCDIIVGGFPCQSFSTVNPTKDPFDDRANLYKQMVRVVRDKQPKVFIAENVKLKSGRQFAKCKALSSRLFLFNQQGCSSDTSFD